MKYNIYIVLMFITLLYCGCSGEVSYPSSLKFEPEIVVDGWIEEGERPIIILSQIVPTDITLDEATLAQVPLRWAKVTIECGEQSEVMVRRNDSELLMGCYYSTIDMRGESGKSYSIVVEYGDRVATATTTIPNKVEIENYSVEQIEDSYAVNITIDDPAATENRYLTLARSSVDETYYNLTLLGVWSDKQLNTQGNSVNIYRPVNILSDNSVKDGIFFEQGESIDIKLAHIDKQAYEYWLDHQDLYLSNSNFIFPSRNNPRSNVEGGLGCWYGFSASKISVVIE